MKSKEPSNWLSFQTEEVGGGGVNLPAHFHWGLHVKQGAGGYKYVYSCPILEKLLMKHYKSSITFTGTY